MKVETTFSLAVDCAIFGYDDEGLKILLVDYKMHTDIVEAQMRIKLPGCMIAPSETIHDAAKRAISREAGLEHIYLKQSEIFSDPNRVVGCDLDWYLRVNNTHATRVITIGYYALIRITPAILRSTKQRGSRWYKIDDVPRLAMDHNKIIRQSLTKMREEFENSPIAFDLLPKRFTIREMQNLYSAVMGVEVDSRNFRKRILSTDIIRHTGEKEIGVAHKPAEYFTFSPSAYRKSVKRGLRYL